MGNIEKIVYGCIGIIFFVAGIAFVSCQSNATVTPSKVTPPLINPPSVDFGNDSNAFHAGAADAGSASTNVGIHANQIEAAASQGQAKTPTQDKALLDPFWTSIFNGVGLLKGDAAGLKDLQTRLATAETTSKTYENNAKAWEDKYRKDMASWVKKYDDEHKARQDAESSVTKALRDKYIWISVACFSGLVICITLAMSGLGGVMFSKWSTGGAVASALGLAISITLVQTVALIPWIVGGIALIAGGFVIYEFFIKNKTTAATAATVVAKEAEKQKLAKIAKQLVLTAEASKPFMTMAGRRTIYGDGPIVGKAHAMQNDETREFVRKARLELSNKAPSLPLKVSCDWIRGANNDEMSEMEKA